MKLKLSIVWQAYTTLQEPQRRLVSDITLILAGDLNFTFDSLEKLLHQQLLMMESMNAWWSVWLTTFFILQTVSEYYYSPLL